MTTISAKKIGHVKNKQGNQLATFEWVYPRWIHAEGRTHRLLSIGEEMDISFATPSPMEDPNLSRNGSSSRAVPVSKMIAAIEADPAMPLFWGKNQKGMQADEECHELIFRSDRPFKKKWTNEEAWLGSMRDAIEWAKAYDQAGYHKQIINRILEPYSHIRVVVSATEWTNFFGLRRHRDAEPHIKMLADATYEAMNATPPKLIRPGEWYLPYVSDEEIELHGIATAIKISVARCASVSYKTVDGKEMTVERAVALFDRLLSSQPLHASPAEHQAQCDWYEWDAEIGHKWLNPRQWGNFKGFIQYRKTLDGEHISK